MSGLGALQSNSQHQDEGLSGAVSDHHVLLCWVCFFVWWGAWTQHWIPSQPGRKSEKQWKTTWCLSTGLGSVLGLLFASKRLGKRFWTLVSDPCHFANAPFTISTPPSDCLLASAPLKVHIAPPGGVLPTLKTTNLDQYKNCVLCMIPDWTGWWDSSFGVLCTVKSPLHCHDSQICSEPKWSYLLGSPQWVK